MTLSPYSKGGMGDFLILNRYYLSKIAFPAKTLDRIVKLAAHRAGLPGKETMLTLHPLSPPTRRGLRDVLPVKKAHDPGHI